MPELRLVGIIGVAAAVLLAVGAATSMADVKSPSSEHTVVMENVGFSPKTLAIKAGDRIRWVNKDLFPHTATADGKAFDSRAIAPNASWVFVARKPGTYTYGCTFHPTMKGTITVQ